MSSQVPKLDKFSYYLHQKTQVLTGREMRFSKHLWGWREVKSKQTKNQKTSYVSLVTKFSLSSKTMHKLYRIPQAMGTETGQSPGACQTSWV